MTAFGCVVGLVLGGAALAKYLQEEKNAGAKVLDIRYAGAEPDLTDALRQWDYIGRASNTEKYLYHLSINPAHDEQLTPAQLERTLYLLDKEHKFENQPRAVIMHEKDGLQHYHVVWLRIDTDSPNLRAISDS